MRRATPATHGQHTTRAFRADPHLTTLAEPRQEHAPTPNSARPDEPAKDTLRLGQHIHEARLARGLSLHQIERICKIRWEFLQAIEQENWDYMPREELRRALRIYTGYLGIDLPKLINRPKPEHTQPLFPLQFAAALALVMVLVVVGIYLL